MATVADVRCTPEFVESLRRAGMRAVRINSAHVTGDRFRQMVATIRAVDPAIEILMDTKGPEVRTTALPHDVEISVGEAVDFTSGHEPSTPERIVVAVDDLHRYVAVSDELLVDDGELRFVVESIEGAVVHTRAVNSGLLGSRKTVALPGGVVPPLPAVSERDRANIALAVECGIDMIAHSFVRSAADVRAVRELIAGSGIALYAKIECREALADLEAITHEADGLLVARGDLGTSIALEEIPAAQITAVEASKKAGKPTILATQILQSMIGRPTPTRAELSDVTLAVLEGFDYLLLCGETAQGDYPQQCVEFMSRTIETAQRLPWQLSKTI